MHSKPALPITTAELRQAWRRGRLWAAGWTFERACATGIVRWSLEKSALAARQRPDYQAQLRLI